VSIRITQPRDAKRVVFRCPQAWQFQITIMELKLFKSETLPSIVTWLKEPSFTRGDHHLLIIGVSLKDGSSNIFFKHPSGRVSESNKNAQTIWEPMLIFKFLIFSNWNIKAIEI
jgi:hypothetical protein